MAKNEAVIAEMGAKALVPDKVVSEHRDATACVVEHLKIALDMAASRDGQMRISAFVVEECRDVRLRANEVIVTAMYYGVKKSRPFWKWTWGQRFHFAKRHLGLVHG